MQRLLYIAHAYLNRGGTELHIKALAENLSKEFDVCILFPEPGYINLLEVKAEKIMRLPAPQVPWPLTPYRFPKLETPLMEMLKGINPDIIHVHHLMHWPLCLLDLLEGLGKPTVLTLHDYYLLTPHFTMQEVQSAEETITSEYAQKIFKADISEYLIERRKVIGKSLSRVKNVIVPSDFAGRIHKEIFGLDYKVIEHGIQPFEPKPKAPSEAIRFGYIGSLLPQKGWHILLEAFLALSKDYPNVSLSFFGGTKPQDLQIPETVSFHGVYDLQDLPDICAQFDIGIIPSLFRETYSLTLSELWMGKVPVIASRLGALSDRVKDNTNGMTFEAGNANELRQSMEWFIQNDSWRSWKLPAPKKEVDMCQDYLKLYNSILK